MCTCFFFKHSWKVYSFQCKVLKDELNLLMNDNFLYSIRGDNTQMQYDCFQSNAIGIQEENSFMDLPNL